MSSRVPRVVGTAAIVAGLMLSVQALAQSDDADLELRIQRLENQLRQLTGQNEELQYRNRQLEERLRQLQGGLPPAAQGGVQGGVAAVPPAQTAPSYGQPQPQPGQFQSGQIQGGYAQPQPGYGPVSYTHLTLPTILLV